MILSLRYFRIARVAATVPRRLSKRSATSEKNDWAIIFVSHEVKHFSFRSSLLVYNSEGGW